MSLQGKIAIVAGATDGRQLPPFKIEPREKRKRAAGFIPAVSSLVTRPTRTMNRSQWILVIIVFYFAMYALPRLLGREKRRQLFFSDSQLPPFRFSLRALLVAVTIVAAMIVLFMKLGQ